MTQITKPLSNKPHPSCGFINEWCATNSGFVTFGDNGIQWNREKSDLIVGPTKLSEELFSTPKKVYPQRAYCNLNLICHVISATFLTKHRKPVTHDTSCFL